MKTLFIFLAALVAVAWSAQPLSDSISSIGGTGKQTIRYMQGDEPIVSASFELPGQLAAAISQVTVTGWDALIQGNTLKISNGSLPPGQTLELDYRISKYVEPGIRTLPGSVTTSSGRTYSTPGNIEVSAFVYLYLILDALRTLAVPLSIALVPTLILWQRKRLFPRSKPPVTEPETFSEGGIDIGDVERQDNGEPVAKAPEEKEEKEQPPEKVGIDITACPPGFVPEGLNYVSFTARIYGYKDGQWVFPGPPAQITFQLHKVSNEKGICMNYGKTEAPDLWLPQEMNAGFKFFQPNGSRFERGCPETILGQENPNHAGHFQMATTSSLVTEATILVRSEDFGGWGWVEAHATPKHIQLPPRAPGSSPGPSSAGYPYSPGETVREYWVKIPFDTNGNNVPDCCTAYDRTGGEDGLREDRDGDPKGDGTPGDGLTVYEEYRGFIVNEGAPVLTKGRITGYAEKHIRTSPEKKDVFIFVQPPDLAEAVRACPFKYTGLDMHIITNKDYVSPLAETESPEINFNNGYACGLIKRPEACRQHAIWVRKRSPAGKGQAQACAHRMLKKDPLSFPWTPRMITHVCIREKIVNDGCSDNASVAQRKTLLAIIAHEMGHAVNIPHHGAARGSADEQGKIIKGLKYAEEGGMFSGDTDCVMRYYGLVDGWYGKDGSLHHTYTDKKKNRLDGPGATYCSTKKGSGVNCDGNVSNDAQEGECKSKIRVKDW